MKRIRDAAVLAELVRRLERVTASQTRLWGTMSAQQMLVHLGDGAEAALARRPFAAPDRPGSSVLKWIALRLPLPWPREIRTGADPASREISAEAFSADRARALRTLRELAAPESTLAERHPIFGPMSRSDWHRWAFLHTDHHLRQFGL
ncbi:MAG: DUF1569 domain-containing protein [Gemmatimonadales bacterium]|nr:MAG: DUF1569 domain-containing protein [Gemmatimonadales bacterium]